MHETPRLRVMFVDDNVDLLKAYRWILESEGYDVITAGSGEQALSVLAAGPRPDGIFIDYSMPMMDGAELVAKIREQQAGSAASRLVIFTSFSPNAPQLDNAKLAGVDIAEKPNDIHSLSPLIQKFLKKPN
jgi:CheY-like chemotaxis protein